MFAALLAFPYANAFAANVWVLDKQVLGIQPTANGFILFLPAHTDDTCPNNGGNVTVTAGQNSMTATLANASMSVALAALAAGKPVHVAYEPTGLCYVAAIKISAVTGT